MSDETPTTVPATPSPNPPVAAPVPSPVAAPVGNGNKLNWAAILVAVLGSLTANITAGGAPSEDDLTKAISVIAAKGSKLEDSYAKNIFELQGAVNYLSGELGRMRKDIDGIKAARTVPGGPSDASPPVADELDAGATNTPTEPPDASPSDTQAPVEEQRPSAPICPPREGDVFLFTPPQKTF